MARSRQVGKTTLLDHLGLESQAFLDDLLLRRRAREDPALFMDDLRLPCLIDEVQYAPDLFPELKLRIDRLRRERTRGKGKARTLFYLTGSNRLLLDRSAKESLAGRCSVHSLHGLSVKEILASLPGLPLKRILFRGGFPELYARADLPAPAFMNSYVTSFVEKDVAAAAGIEKLGEFQTVLGLLAARSGQFVKPSEVSAAAGVDQKTVQAWIDLLQRNHILRQVPPFSSNLSKRITKLKKLYFYDVGLCSRLQGHLDETLLWNSPQAGALFETLVFSELVKTRDNFMKDWRLFTWRTKERDEVDFILQSGGAPTFIEAKLAIHGARPFALDREALRVFPPPHRKVVVTAGGDVVRLDRETVAVPVQKLGAHLLAA